MSSTRIWFSPIQIFHWIIALNFVISYLTGDSEYWRLIHINAGYTIISLAIFRIIWGSRSVRYPRFSDFVKSPIAGLNYLRLLMLGVTITTAIIGFVLYNILEENELLEELHEILANIMLTLVGLHILLAYYRRRINQTHLTLGIILLTIICGFWFYQWQFTPIEVE